MTLYLKQDEPLLQGDCLHVKAKVHAVDFAESEYSWSRASSASLYVTSFELQDDTSPLGHLRAIRKAALEAFSEGSTESGMLKAVTCGYRHDINGSDEYRAFQTCGLAHLVAVSGAHLAIVAGIFYLCKIWHGTKNIIVWPDTSSASGWKRLGPSRN